MPGATLHRITWAMTNDALVRRAFDAYNARDSETLLTLVADDVTWPSRSGLLHGRRASRDFWMGQWERTRTHDAVTRISLPAPTCAVARIRQTVRSIEDVLLSTGTFNCAFTVERGLIQRLETRSAEACDGDA